MIPVMRDAAKFLLIMAALLLPARPSLALQVGELDGQWCSPDRQSISVSGTSIIAPSGIRTTGRYGKHALSFTAPRHDGRPGAVIWMEPAGNDKVRVSVAARRQKEPPPHDIWMRCPSTSALSNVDCQLGPEFGQLPL